MHINHTALLTTAKQWYKHTSFTVLLNVGFAVLGVIITRLLGGVTQMMLARLMGVATFGVYTMVYALLGPVVTIANLGLSTWLLRKGGEIESLDTTISQVFSLRLLMIVFLMPMGIVIVMAQHEPRITLILATIAAMGLTGEMLLTTAHIALRAQVRNWAAALLQVVVAALMIMLIVLFWDDTRGLLVAAESRLVAAILGMVAFLWLLRRSLHISWHVGQLLNVVKQARIYFLADIFAHITLSADIFLISLLLGNVAAGLYNPALTIINVTFIVPRIVWQVLLPILSQRTKHSQRTLHWLIAASTAGSVLYGVGWFVAFFWQSQWIIHLLFTKEYDAAVPLVRIMALIPLMKSINFSTATVMVAYDEQVLRTRLQAIASVFNVVGNIIAIPMVGVVGAAWVYLFTESTLLVCYGSGAWYTLRRRSA